MRLIHAKGFSAQERAQWKVTIFSNLVHAFQVVFSAMEEQEVDFAQSHNIVSTQMSNSSTTAKLTDGQRFAQLIAADPEIQEDQPMSLDCLKAFQSLWKDSGVQVAIQKGNEYALHDNLT